MGKQRTDRYRTLDLVVYVGPHRHSVSVFATDHRGGDQSKHLLVRAVLLSDAAPASTPDCLALLHDALRELERNPLAPWR